MSIVRKQAENFADAPAWPERAPPAAGSVVGHNRPPPDEAARIDFNEALDAALREKGLTRARFDELVAAAGRARATDEETVGKCGELVRQLRAAMKLVDDIHGEVKAPYLAASRAIDDLRNTAKAPLDKAKRETEAKQTEFLREQELIRQAELRRQREAEQARLLAEAEARAAAAPSVTDEFLAAAGREMAPAVAPVPEAAEPIRGDFGATVSGRKEWKAHVLDYEVAFMAVADNEKVREAIDKAIAGMVRNGARKIDGVRIYEDIKASTR